jgi:hypothetical protein
MYSSTAVEGLLRNFFGFVMVVFLVSSVERRASAARCRLPSASASASYL